jgi:transcriptional regulator with XRE-family HTH domain
MTTAAFDRAAARVGQRIAGTFGDDVRRLRDDAGISKAALARAAGIDASYLGDIEDGTARPSSAICIRIALALGADVALRLYPTTGPAIRDRHPSALAESILCVIHPKWTRHSEIAVRQPSRGWIDLGLHASNYGVFVATEIQSELRRLEQLVRWSEAKAAALPSWEGWPHLGEQVAVSKLLVIRDTRTNRDVAATFRRLLRTAYPSDPDDALAALVGDVPWPGAALLWASPERGNTGRYRLVARR